MALRAHDLPALPEPVELVEQASPTVCRRAGCGELAGADGLCTAHGAQQTELRVVVERIGTAPLPRLPLSRPRWYALAACKGMGPERFYPPTSSRRTTTTHPYRDAQKVCATCTVVDECRQAGMVEAHGVWGGQSPGERRMVRRNL